MSRSTLLLSAVSTVAPVGAGTNRRTELARRFVCKFYHPPTDQSIVVSVFARRGAARSGVSGTARRILDEAGSVVTHIGTGNAGAHGVFVAAPSARAVVAAVGCRTVGVALCGPSGLTRGVELQRDRWDSAAVRLGFNATTPSSRKLCGPTERRALAHRNRWAEVHVDESLWY
jgi:hypothetical protein